MWPPSHGPISSPLELSSFSIYLSLHQVSLLYLLYGSLVEVTWTCWFSNIFTIVLLMDWEAIETHCSFSCQYRNIYWVFSLSSVELPKRGFWLQFYMEVTKSGPYAKFPVHLVWFCLAQLHLDISMVANRTGRDLLWYNLVALWYNSFHKLLKLKSDWIACFSGKGSENLIALEETSFQFPA